MNYESKQTPEIYLAPTVKPIKDIPKRPEEQPVMVYDLSKDNLMEYAATRLLAIPFDEKTFKTDDIYMKSYLASFIKGVIAYATLGFRDIGFPVNEFIEKQRTAAEKALIRKRILR
jgi:hypothetical protein